MEFIVPIAFDLNRERLRPRRPTLNSGNIRVARDIQFSGDGYFLGHIFRLHIDIGLPPFSQITALFRTKDELGKMVTT